jgi:hypothetical protein
MRRLLVPLAIGLASEAAAQDGEPGDLRARLQELEARLEALEAQAARPPAGPRLSGHVDLGFFVPLGNDGQGVRRDDGHRFFPEHAAVGWVFYGDLLAPQVNSRGEAADLGDLPGAPRFDSIDSNGNPSFLVNEVNLTVTAALSPRLLLGASANLVPRTGREFALGDFLDVDLAQLEWLPTDDGRLSLFAGKVESVLGHEYRTRKASRRFGVTPTLVARYTTGTALGVKGRAKLLGERLVVAAALTNGSFGSEQFHFHDELDANAGKTLSGRVALRLPVGGLVAELGLSGQAGAQDAAPDGAGLLWLAGADLEVTSVAFALRAQWMIGHAPGDETARAYRLELGSSGYLEATWLTTPWLGLLARAELRDADVRLGDERLYVTRSWRAVAGVRLVLSPSLVLKGELLHNGEYGGVPSFPNDVLTTSLVAVY